MDNSSRMHIVTVMAHPDDAEVNVGGLAAIWADAGHRVTFVTMCRGELGHHRMDAEAAIHRRQAEAEAAARSLGAAYESLAFPECAFMPDIGNRLALIRCLRRLAPDIIITHPMDDYHVDHRHASRLAADALFLLQVPKVAPELPALRRMPRLFHAVHRRDYAESLPLWHAFPVDGMRERRLKALALHESQMFEWLPWVSGWPEPPPPGQEEERLRYVEAMFEGPGRWLADRRRAELIAGHGEAGARCECAEALYATPASGAAAPDFLRSLSPRVF